jgi:dienelactone hydrolase
MIRPPRFATATLLGAVLLPLASVQAEDAPLSSYFEAEVERITADPLLGINSAEDWKARRPRLQQRLRSMLGLDPLPEKTDLEVEVRGTMERPDFVVERILYQSSPGLYVTANLYRPKEVTEPLPAILYVCGHANVVQDGVIYGCKAHYQHHAAWYAANGYVCLVVDTLQLGEIPGLHHGTYREGKWWWQSRGYTPAGVEVWNGIRAIDYLQSRPEVDPDRIGVTGRSGGGAMSWYLGAVDDRLAAVIPVAGVIEGHCDCMYMVNTDAWDFDVLAALVAPKPLLVENTDADPIFPEPGVRRIYEQLETVYEWYDATDRLGLVIGEGGHVDSEEIRHPSFAFMNTWLKGEPTDPSDIEEPDRSVPIEDLKVLDVDEPIPSDSRNASIDESFVPKAEAPPLPKSAEEWQSLRSNWLDLVRAEVFDASSGKVGTIIADRPYPLGIEKDGLELRAFDFWPQSGADQPKLRVWIFADPDRDEDAIRAEFRVLAEDEWKTYGGLIDAFESEDGDPMSHPEFEAMREKARSGVLACLFAPRGVGPTAWPEDRDTHTRRRFPLIGQTLDGTRVLDVRRALKGIGLDRRPLWISGAGEAAPVALWAAVFEPEIDRIILIDPPASVDEPPAFLNLGRLLEMPQAVALLFPRHVMIEGDSDRSAFGWAADLARRLGHEGPWPVLGD